MANEGFYIDPLGPFKSIDERVTSDERNRDRVVAISLINEQIQNLQHSLKNELSELETIKYEYKSFTILIDRNVYQFNIFRPTHNIDSPRSLRLKDIRVQNAFGYIIKDYNDKFNCHFGSKKISVTLKEGFYAIEELEESMRLGIKLDLDPWDDEKYLKVNYLIWQKTVIQEE